MRMKRLLSLVLAFAMLASLTISASAAVSEVYYVQNFDYTDVDEFAADFHTQNTTARRLGVTTLGASITVDPETSAKTINDTSAFLGTYDSGVGIPVLKEHTAASGKAMHLYKGFNGATYGAEAISAENSSFITNANGDKAFVAYDKAESNLGAHIFFIPSKPFNVATSTNEKYVISYDVQKTAETGVALDTTYGDAVLLSGNNRYTAYGIGKKGVYNNAVSFQITALADGVNKFAFISDGVADVSGVQNVKWTGTLNGTSCIQYVQAPIAQRNVGEDGVTYISGNTNYDATTIEGYSIYVGKTLPYAYSNIRMYTLSTAAGAFAVQSAPTTGATNVKLADTTVTVKFTQPVDASTFTASAVKVYKDGDLMNGGYTVGKLNDVVEAVGGEIYTTVDVEFDALEYDATYEIEMPSATKNTIGTVVSALNNTATFTTEVPEVVVSNFNAVTAFGTDAETRVPNGNFTAGTLQGAALDVKNATSATKNIAVIYAVYSNSQLTDMVYANAEIAGGKTATVEAGVTLAATASTVKAFVWDGFTALKPYTDATTKTVAAQ